MNIRHKSYDEMKADGWDYHRNGVSGVGFFVKYDDGLLISFNYFDDDDDEVNLPVIVVPETFLPHLTTPTENDRVVGGKVVHRALSDRYNLVGFTDPNEGKMIAIQDLTLEDRATAVFQADLLPDVRFMHNSWRGDRFHGFVKEACAR